MNRNKRIGTAAEVAVRRYLNGNGFRRAERLASDGMKDRGDITGTPAVIEVKNHATVALGPWMAELEAEMLHAKKTIGAVWHKRRGTTDPGEWFVTMPGHVFIEFLKDAKYRDRMD